MEVDGPMSTVSGVTVGTGEGVGSYDSEQIREDRGFIRDFGR